MSIIKIVDAMMGKGKTTFAIQKMKNDTENSYIYITPFLSEVQRIKEQCKTKRFYEPLNVGKGKLDSLHNLLKDGKNIASTHALFRMSTDVTRDLIKANNYILILDEVCDVIEQVPLKKNDMDAILKHAHLENDFLVWDNMDYDGRYNDIKIMALNNSLMYVNNTLIMWNFPVSVFQVFKECYILTYLFEAQIQRYYYDLHNVNYEYYTIDNNYKLILFKDKKTIDKSNIKSKIHILENDVINNIGDNEFALSASWFEKDKNKQLVKKLKNNLFNYFKNKMKSKSDKIMWTTFKDYKSKLSGNGYTKGFVSCNARATNDFKEREILAYCVNIFLNPIIKQFFTNKNINVLEDRYALSEMLQWIWRSAIRDNKEIYIYIPSKRMRTLLNQWLKDQTF